MKTYELTGQALDWAVAHAQGAGAALVLTHSHGQALILSDHTEDCDIGEHYQPSINWSQGGPIIERERITVVAMPNGSWQSQGKDLRPHFHNATPLIAAMRCYVASKLGDEVDVPNEIVEAVK
jgi:hypothetical protein